MSVNLHRKVILECEKKKHILKAKISKRHKHNAATLANKSICLLKRGEN